MVATTTNPTECGSHKKGNCINPGTVTNLQVVTNLRGGDRTVTKNKLPNNKKFILEDPAACEELPTGSELVKMINLSLKQRGCLNTLVNHNKAVKLKLPRAYSSKSLQTCKSSSSHGGFSNGNVVGQKGF